MTMFQFRVTPDRGEPFDLTAGMRDVRWWEKTHRGRSMGMLQSAAGVSAGVLFEIAYSAARRQGFVPDTMTGDAFADAFEIDVETAEEHAARLKAEALVDRINEADAPADEQAEGGEDPTHAALSAAPSSHWLSTQEYPPTPGGPGTSATW